jgi:hypothetical protein
VTATPHPSRIIPNNLLPTRKLIHARRPILTTLPQPTPIPISLHNLPLKSRSRLNFHISTAPDVPVRFRSILVSIQRYRAGQIPVSELGDGAGDVDAVAVLGADLDGEGERDGCGVGAGWGGVCYGDAERCSCFAVSRGVDVVGVHEGVDCAVVGKRGGSVGDVIGVCCCDDLGGGVVAGGRDVLVWTVNFGGFYGNDEHGLGEVLLQGEVEVADLELLGEFEGGVGVLVAVVFGGAREPLINWCLIRVVAPPAMRALSVCGVRLI